jgi:hypothetical protein
LIGVGLALFRFRKRLQDINSDFQKAAFGPAGENLSKNTPKGSIGAAGIFAVVLGILFILISLLYKPSDSSSDSMSSNQVLVAPDNVEMHLFAAER